MKFLKPDGTIEEGEPLNDDLAIVREQMERFIHLLVCHGRYHGTYDGHPCRDAANFLSISLATVDGLSSGEMRKYAAIIGGKVDELLPKPKAMQPPILNEDVIAVEAADDKMF